MQLKKLLRFCVSCVTVKRAWRKHSNDRKPNTRIKLFSFCFRLRCVLFAQRDKRRKFNGRRRGDRRKRESSVPFVSPFFKLIVVSTVFSVSCIRLLRSGRCSWKSGFRPFMHWPLQLLNFCKTLSFSSKYCTSGLCTVAHKGQQQQKSHNAKNKSQNAINKCHNAINKCHNAINKSQNAKNKSHNAKNKCHNTINKCHNVINKTHNAINKCYNAINICHNAINKTHNAINKCHNAINKTHNAINKTHNAISKLTTQ